MKPFMLRHKHKWLPKKLDYGKEYWISYIAVAHEGFRFKLSKNSSHIELKDNNRVIIVSKRQLKKEFKEGLLRFANEINPEDDKAHLFKKKKVK